MNIHALVSEHYREMGSIARTLHTRNDGRFGELGLQKGQFVFLTRLCEHPGITVVALARLARVDQTTATKAVQKLEKSGYVKRENDPTDRRSVCLTATEKAHQAYGAIIAHENADLAEGLAGLTSSEAATLLALLARVRANLDGAP